MDYIWDATELPMPSLNVVKVKKIKFEVAKLKKILEDAIIFYECQTPFNEHADLLAKLVQKRKSSFRHFKGFQDACQAKTALKRLEKVNLPNVLKNFAGLLPESVFTLELPPQVNLEYVLLRTIAQHHLLERICKLCRYAAKYFLGLLRNNYFIEILSLFLAVLSKIWYDGGNMARYTAKLYLRLKNYLSLLPQNKNDNDTKFFSGFEFPQALDCDSAVEQIDDKTSESEQKVEKEEKLITKKSKSHKQTIKLVNSGQSSNNIAMDLGVAISRDSFTPVFDSNQINSIEEIKKYFNEQNTKQQQKGISSGENNSKQMWIKKRILYKIRNGENSDAIQMFQKFFNKS